MDKQYNVVELLDYIDPAALSYEEWVSVGMALKEAGASVADWEAWSHRDIGRYHRGECEKKWNSFRGSFGNPITAGTIVAMAKDNGWRPPLKQEDYELSWEDTIGGKDDLVVIDEGWIEGKEIHEPKAWKPTSELIKYLEILFEAGENVGYVTESWKKDDKFLPTKGVFDRTAGELIELLNKNKADIGAVIGDYKEEAGAWIRFNPLDGKGCKNENVTEYRYALVESDTMDIEKQNAVIRELELPVACLVHSGGKSLHAIVRIEAGSYDEYRKRVDYLYDVCRKNGLEIDRQNKNPSRLSRMPGITRKGHKQFIVDTNIGKESWAEWKDWIESVNDDLPEPEPLTDVWDNLPELAPPLIDGVLRQGHKMLLAGPSKAGKSYALIELCCAIAEGRRWLRWKCTQGRVLYVNLELDRASCLHRFKDVYKALFWQPDNLSNIDIWNLRGRSIPMDKLAPKLIRRAAKKNYIAVIIDPIYKIITGDENSADQMARFCNQFDLVCHELGAAVIYCHHHSKGGQGQKKSMDRASGSGVFARDPDALLDLIELEISEDITKQQINKAACAAAIGALEKYSNTWEQHTSQDDMCSFVRMREKCEEYLTAEQYKEALCLIREAESRAKSISGWRIEGTLREYQKFAPVNLWFDYPVHHIDDCDILKDVDAGGEAFSYKKNFLKKKTPEERKKGRAESIEVAYEACSINEKVTLKAMAEYLGMTEKTARNHIREHGDFWVDNGEVGKK